MCVCVLRGEGFPFNLGIAQKIIPQLVTFRALRWFKIHLRHNRKLKLGLN
jgi:hypothetical protein